MPEETTSKPTNKVLWIDPPEGWRYGFPRAVPKGIEGDAINEWMIKVGYPKEKMEAYGESFYCGMWYEEKD
jgi:hypothetical protein